MSMWDEESFPRGGTVEISSGTKRKRTKSKPEKELFRSGHEDDASKSKKKKKYRHMTLEKRVAAKKVTDREVDHRIKKNLGVITHLTITSCPVNMLVLGCVKEVHDYYLDVSLPNGITGRVPITALSATYTNMLQKLAKGDFSVATDLKSLKDLFRPGMVVRCKISEVKADSKKTKASLSLNPRDVNSCLQGSDMKNGIVLCGCVASVEDHGYVVDLGVSGVVAFLKKKEAEDYIQDYNDGAPLALGAYLHCMISSDDKIDMMTGENRTLHVTINPRKVFRAQVTPAMGLKMNTLLPGMRVAAKVHKVYERGVRVQFLSYVGTIHRTHLMQHVKKLEPGQQLTASVLYVHPVTKVVSLTCQLHLVTPDLAPRRLFGDMRYGNIVEDAKVLKVDVKAGIYLSLDERIVGFAHVGNVSDGEVKDLSRQFPKGSKVRCRVMNFDYSDNLVLVTLKKSVLDREFLRHEDIKVAEDIEVEVKTVSKGGVGVMIATHMKGFIPNSHTADVPLKHPERRFTPGTKITARVLTVDVEEKKIILTVKKSILDSKYTKITEFRQARRGLVLEGVITKVMDKGVRVLFYNGVKGFVPKVHLGSEFVDDPTKAFYVGQVVRVQVVKCVPDEEKLILSMKIINKKEQTNAAKIPDDMHVGQLLDVVVRGKVDKGLYVEVPDTKVQAFLPKEHLSDHVANTALLHETYQKGDPIEDCAVLSLGTRITVTKKHCLVAAAREESLIKTFDDIKLGLEVPGTIRNKKEYGLFVDLSAGLIGLAPVKFLLDERLPDSTSLFTVGQSVIAKVTEVDEEKKRVLLSLRLKDCYHGDVQQGIALLENYLCEAAVIMARHQRAGAKQTLASHTVGSIVTVTVTKVTKDGVLCVLPDGTKVLATEDHIRGVDCTVRKKAEAVVLYVDLTADCLEVSLNTALLSHIKHYAESKFTKARMDQVIKSEVLLIKEDFVLIALRGHAQGLLAYLPAKMHLNDLMEKRQYQITQQNAVVIKRTTDVGILASLQIHDPGEKAKKKEKGPGHHLLPGIVVKAKIRKVLDFQLNIAIGDVFGRVHISEVADKVKEGTNPLSKLKPGQEFRVKVIGYRELKTNKHLPITHSKIWTTLPECSLKASKLQSNGLLQSEDVHQSAYDPGDKVTVYVQDFNKNCLWVQVSPKFRGKIQRHNISDDESVCEKPLSHYAVGKAYRATVLGPGKANVLDLSFVGRRETVTISEGDVMEGTVTKASELGVLVRLGHGYMGRVGLPEITDKYVDRPWEAYSEGEKVKAYVIKCTKRSKCVLSLRESRISECFTDGGETIPDPVLTVDDVKEETLVRGYISNNANRNKMFVALSHDLGARVPKDKIAEAVLKNPSDVFFIGKVVCGKIIKAKLGEKTVITLSLLEADTGLPNPTDSSGCTPAATATKSKKRKRSANEEETSPKKTKNDVTKADKKKSKKEKKNKVQEAAVKDVKDADDEGDSDSGVEEDIRLLSPKAVLKTAPRLALSGGFTWGSDATLPPPIGQSKEEDSDSGEEEEESDKKKKVRKSRAERLAVQREEERRLVESERHLADGDSTPQGAEEFDRLVLQSPDSSLVWLGYMAHHLEMTEIEKARAVAERALKTISFREEQEKLNVWLAYLNLENMYGTPELLKLVFDRAVSHNDSLKVHNQMVNIYDTSNKEEAADTLYQSMIRRFGPLKDVWINYGLFLFKHNKAEESRKLMQCSLKSLDRKHHIEILSKFAQMEFKHGEPERGRTMFENVLSSYPRRTDLWSVYIDMVIKQGQHQQIRSIFERVVGLNLAAKKMKFFFKKQLDFEQKFGSEDTVAAVKQSALDYVEARAALT